ncbi:hypothetical protein B0T17DRAFT_497767 [Bombardia bombarda]|uniref:Ras-GAP domain-containing protein n=1 Tax=Bombardia bombarda TaxID=252184 RepID=A0AA40BVA7_9PEZI|nr:hypothetical protein B0T17DRAFT_497767 [Bombardia bombarda]
MEGRTFPFGGAPPLPERPPPPPAHSTVLPSVAEVPLPRGMDSRLSTTNLRAGFRPGPIGQSSVRAVTPEPADVSQKTRGPGPGSISPQTSPRSIPGAAARTHGTLPPRRQGVVFSDPYSGSLDSTSTSPPPRPPSVRPRTHTMDGAFRQQLAPQHDTRRRKGSFSSSGSLPITEDPTRFVLSQSTFESYRPSESQSAASVHVQTKDRKTSSMRSRLTKRPSSRPSSPLSSPQPSVDSLPLPIPTSDANKILLLMKNLCGRMRGEVEYQREPGGPWYEGICYIEEDKGCLMFDSGENGPFHAALISDLKGCRVLPMEQLDQHNRQCLEITSPPLNSAIILRPLLAEELDLWLAALLCWQQLRPAVVKPPVARPGNVGTAPSGRPELRPRESSLNLRDSAIIKVGKVMLWDKGAATSPRAIVKRPSTRDLRSTQTSWRKVSCILSDNGELKLMTENDTSVLSVIELSQLARAAIQQLDKSVLDEEHCIAIFPIYSSNSTQLSIFRPVYISLESRVLFEVWFVLFRAFTMPDIYGLDAANGNQVYVVTDFTAEPTGEAFRVEKTITVRVTEAKIRGRTQVSDNNNGPTERRGRSPEHDPAIGNYLAEVMLDGEVRARTTTKMGTKNPFWREDCVFMDLPSSLPYLSVLLKRVDSSTESFSHQLQATLGIPKTGHVTEALCGCVDIPLHQLDRGKDHEQWLHIYDERQQTIGTMFVKVHHEELVVLLSQHYRPLSELLHRFNSGLTAQMTDALPGNLRRVAEVLLNIFQVSGSATEWLMNMIEDEIDGVSNQSTLRKPRFGRRLKSNDSIESTSDREQLVRDMGKSLQGEANLLFRGNSLLTQALEFHMRRLGKEYLEDILADKIIEINDLDPNCEVDPGKLQHGEDMQQHWNQLIRLTTEIWECIASSASRLPPELRHILKYIRAMAEDRYGDFLRTVTYTSVSGFLFLRFICPAILNPKLFGLLRDHPRPRAQRTLTLIAKGLQALANLSTIGKKETWMEPMNRFLNTQRQSFKDFLDVVCAIPVERTNVILPASYSTPIAILGRLSTVQREGFPSLPYLVDHARNFAALVKLWVDAHPISAPAASSSGGLGDERKVVVFDGDLLEFHKVCNALHQRAAECFTRVESLRNNADHNTAAAAAAATMDDLSPADVATATMMMDKASLGESNAALLHASSSYNSNSSAAWMEYNEGGSGYGKPPGSSGSEMDGASRFGKDARFGGRETSSLRQVSRSSELSNQSTNSNLGSGGSGGGTVRGLRNNIHPRKFLSGFITRSSNKATALDGSGGSPTATTMMGGKESSKESKEREKDRERERERDRDMEREKQWEKIKDSRDRDRDRDRGIVTGIPETVIGIEIETGVWSWSRGQQHSSITLWLWGVGKKD